MSSGTPLIVDTSVDSFENYIKSLSKKSRKNWSYVQKHNQDLTYSLEPYNKPLVDEFMQVWSKQIIHGNEEVRWGFDISYVNNLNESGVLRTFVARLNGVPIAVHFVEKHGEYVECHPPMYDKKYSDRYLAKYMWFNLIKWAIECDVHWIDLGSGDRGNWRELLLNRDKYPRIKYKWLYISEEVKNNPGKQPEYLVYNENNHKYIR